MFALCSVPKAQRQGFVEVNNYDGMNGAANELFFALLESPLKPAIQDRDTFL